MSCGIGKLGNPTMGIGALGQNIVFRHKFRWLLEIKDAQGNVIVPADFVKMSARPSIDLEEIDFLNSKSFIPGRLNSSTATMTYYDYDQSNGACFLTKWLAKHVQNGSDFSGVPTATYCLKLLDGTGTEMESWDLLDGVLQSLNFGELDYSQTEPVSLELTVKYEKIKYHCNTNWNFAGDARPVTVTTDEWKMPDEWIIRNPIVTESPSPGAQILDQFLHRMASRA